VCLPGIREPARSALEKTASNPASAETGLARRAAEELVALVAQPLPSGLYLVATPIGNLGDITLRALATLARADVLYCEDTRHSGTLLAHYSIARALRPYHEHNAQRERPRVMAELAAGRAVALISDAGTPLVSDPGYKLVREALAAGHRVAALPGASAPLAALASAGLPTDTFLFAGFLPPKASARRTRLAQLKTVPATLVLFEAPSRLAESLDDIAEVLGPREAAVARELTKLYEEVRRGTPTELARWAADAHPKGEMVVLVGPPLPAAVTDADIAAKLTPMLPVMSLSDAARAAAEDLGVAKARVYEIGVALKRHGGG
jgi:16S rRNA (cytidine1402-2'-O)-methyltransferase